MGSCFEPVHVQCVSGSLEKFEALYGHKKRYENMPLGELLEKAFVYRELVSTCALVTRERGGMHFKTPLREELLPDTREGRGLALACTRR